MSDVILAVSLVCFALPMGFSLARKLRLPSSPFVITAISLIVIGGLTQVPSSPFFTGLNDGEKYQTWGFSLSESWASGLRWEGEQLWPGKGFWPAIIALFHSIAGPVLVSLFVFNALLIALSVIFLQKVTAMMFDCTPRLPFIVLTLTNSSILLNGPTLLREALFWLGVSMGVLGLAYLGKGKKTLSAAFFVASALLILGVRPNYGVILVYLLAFSMIALWFVSKKNGGFARAVVSGTFATALALTFPFSFDFLASDPSTLEGQIETVSKSLGKERVTTAISTPPSLPGDGLLSGTIGQSVSRLPNLVFGPYWWEVGPEPIWIVAVASTLHYWVLLASSSLLVLRRVHRNNVSVILFFLSLITLASLSPVMTNYGIIIRFRVVSEVFLVPLSAYMIQRFFARFRNSSSSPLA